MADVIRTIKFESEGLREMQSELDAINSSVDKVDDGSSLGGLSDKSEDLTNKLRGANQELDKVAKVDYSKIAGGIGQVAGGLGAIATAGALLGAGNEDAEKFFKTFATGLAITNAIKGATETYIGIQVLQTAATEAQAVATVGANTATQTLNKSLLTSPLFAVVAVLGAVAAAYSLFTEEASEAAKAQEEVNKRTVEEVSKMEMLFQSLKQTNPQSQRRKELIDEINGTYGTTLKNLENEGAFASQVAGAYAQVNAQLEKKIKQEVFEETLTDIIKQQLVLEQERDALINKRDNRKRIQDNYERDQRVQDSFNKSISETNDAIAKLEASKQRVLKTINEVNGAQVKSLGDPISLKDKDDDKGGTTTSPKEKTPAEIKKEAKERARLEQEAIAAANLEAFKENYLKYIEERTKFEYDTFLSAQEKEIKAVEEKFGTIIEKAKEYGEETATLEEQQQLEIENIKKKYEDAEKTRLQELIDAKADAKKKAQEAEDAAEDEAEKKRKARNDKRIQQSLEMASAVSNSLNALSAVNSAIEAKQLKEASGNQGKMLEIKKKAFETDKKLKIANTIIEGLSGATAAIAGAMTLGPIVGPIVGGINAAAIVAVSAANVSKIKGTSFDAGSMPSISSSGGGANSSDISGGNTGPNINFNQNGDGTANNVKAGGGSGNDGMIINNSLVISESEITKVQKNVVAYSELSKL